jgi:perosamine synthetase
MPRPFLERHDYDPAQLGERSRCIPGPEPLLQAYRGYPIVPVCEPDLRGDEKAYVAYAMKTGWISSKGDYLTRFEKEFAARVGAKYGCAVNSGTSALHLCMAALDIRDSDTVAVPTFTMASTAFAASCMGASLQLVDADDNYNMSVLGLLALKDHDLSAVVPVHVYGHPVDMDQIEEAAVGMKVPVIYDAAEAHGSLYYGKPIGGRGLASCYSFYANKTITTGEGGMVVSNDEGFIEVCRNLKNVSLTEGRHFWHGRIGYNFRMTNMQAAVGCAQLERFDALVAARQRNAQHYRQLLEDVPGLSFQPQSRLVTSSHWMVGVEVDPLVFGIDRDELRRLLAMRGIETRSYFIPMHLQPCYQSPVVLPNAERLSAQGFYLPSSSTLDDVTRAHVCEQIMEIADGVRN